MHELFESTHELNVPRLTQEQQLEVLAFRATQQPGFAKLKGSAGQEWSYDGISTKVVFGHASDLVDEEPVPDTYTISYQGFKAEIYDGMVTIKQPKVQNGEITGEERVTDGDRRHVLVAGFIAQLTATIEAADQTQQTSRANRITSLFSRMRQSTGSLSEAA